MTSGLSRLKRMKQKVGHTVPLSRQAVEVLDTMGELYGDDGYVFPSVLSNSGMLSENAFSTAFRRCRYSSPSRHEVICQNLHR